MGIVDNVKGALFGAAQTQTSPGPIEGVKGAQHEIGSNEHGSWVDQYASSSYQDDSERMNPGLIVLPEDKDDIKLTIAYANAHGMAVAIRSGGHQYSGASSTGRGNIQLDLRDTFKSTDDFRPFEQDGKTFVRMSVSWPLGSVNKFLGERELFVPHGQCTGVYVGGHAQTGGYGQLGRSFGLFGDQIVEFEFIDHEGQERVITQKSDAELFYAWLGGSPGNFGVLTHLTLRVYRDADYAGSMGVRIMHFYTPETLRRIVQLLAETGDNDDMPRNYDLCVSVLSCDADLMAYSNGVEDQVKIAQLTQPGTSLCIGPMIITYAQWVSFGKDEKPDKAWFEKLMEGAVLHSGLEVKAMSKLTPEWIFEKEREFQQPYVKRIYSSAATNLSTNGWADWLSKRLDTILGSPTRETGQWLAVQLQAMGGKHSRFRLNADNGTSYSWRDTTMIMVIDDFHHPSKKADAEKWQKENDKQVLGPDGIFSDKDRRFLWGSWGSFDLDSVWNVYHEDRAKYERLMKARKAADPNGTFTPNIFSVKRAV